MVERGERVEVLSVGDFARLEALCGLAERIFPAAPGATRPAGWFRRRLLRECVDADLSTRALLRVRDGTTTTVGYCLVGAPPSLRGRGRLAGLGVLAEERGLGIGHRLLEAAARAAGSRGLTELQTHATPEYEGWYLAEGFRVVKRQTTLLAFAHGEAHSDPLAWGAMADGDRSPGEDGASMCSWLAEAWYGTPAAERAIVGLGTVDGVDQTARLTREGSAVLVHRVTGAPGDTIRADLHAARQLLARLPAGAPVLLHGCDPSSRSVDALVQEGWVRAQNSAILTLSLE